MEIRNKILEKKIKECLDKGIWPMKKELSLEIVTFVKTIQYLLAVRVKNTKFIDDSIKILMKEIIGTLPFRILAVEKIRKYQPLCPRAKGQGKGGEGNGKKIEEGKEKIELVKELNLTKLEKYQATLISIPKALPSRNPPNLAKFRDKGRGGKGELGGIKDRCIQELFRLVLDPAIDVLSDKDSYGFRKGRNSHMAIGRIQNLLKKHPENLAVIDVDIKGLFDNNHKNWILQNFPMPYNCEHILESWLKSGVFEKKIDEISEYGVPKGGGISPLITNFTLNGIEKASFDISSPLLESLETLESLERRGDKNFSQIIKGLIRFGKDFVIIINDPSIITKVKKNLREFLKERGLELNLEKTQTLILKNGGKFNFLGYTFDYLLNPQISSFNNRYDLLTADKVFIYPMRKKLKEIKRKLKEVINRNKNISAYQLIKIINPIIQGWASHFSLNICAKTLSHLDNYIYKRLWAWLKKKYPKTSKVFLASKFFICQSPVDRKWHFFGSPTSNNLKRKNDLVFLKFALLTNNLQCASKLALPLKLREDSAYLKESEFLDFALKINKLRIYPKT